MNPNTLNLKEGANMGIDNVCVDGTKTSADGLDFIFMKTGTWEHLTNM